MDKELSVYYCNKFWKLYFARVKTRWLHMFYWQVCLEKNFKNCILLVSNLYFHFKEQWQIDGLSFIEHSNWKNSQVNITPKLSCFNRKTFVVCHLHWVWNLTWFWPVNKNMLKRQTPEFKSKLNAEPLNIFVKKAS